MKKLKNGSVNRNAQPVEISGATFYIRPLSGELYTSFSMYIGEYTDMMLSPRDKRSFIKNHITDWQGVVAEEDGNDVSVDFSMAEALSLLIDEDADDVITYLYSESLSMRQNLDSSKKKDEEIAKK